MCVCNNFRIVLHNFLERHKAVFNVTFPRNQESSMRTAKMIQTKTGRVQKGLICAVDDEK